MLGAIPLVLTDPIKKNKRQEPEKVFSTNENLFTSF